MASSSNHVQHETSPKRIDDFEEEEVFMERPIEAREELGVLDCYAESKWKSETGFFEVLID